MGYAGRELRRTGLRTPLGWCGSPSCENSEGLVSCVRSMRWATRARSRLWLRRAVCAGLPARARGCGFAAQYALGYPRAQRSISRSSAVRILGVVAFVRALALEQMRSMRWATRARSRARCARALVRQN
jgi:hypothetical protein